MEEYYKRKKIHRMARKSNVKCLEAYFYEIDVWSPKTAKRNNWSPKYAIFSSTVGVTRIAVELHVFIF
jgi:predicted nucleic acid binding AN1-type Zn finger protein